MTRSDRLLGSSWRRFTAGRTRAVIAEARHRSVPAGCCQLQVSASTPLYHLTRIHPATISTYHTRRYSAVSRTPRHLTSLTRRRTARHQCHSGRNQRAKKMEKSRGKQGGHRQRKRGLVIGRVGVGHVGPKAKRDVYVLACEL